MKFISIGKCDKHLIYPLIGGISKFVVNLILYYFPDGAELNKHPFMLGINAGLGMSLAIIPFIYLERHNINQRKEIFINNNKNLEELIKKNNLTIKKQKYLVIFLCALLDFVQKVLVFLFHYSISNNIWIFNILFLNIFTFMITNGRIYKHQF